ncbi:aldo/keto reductase [Catelliglobosispora koreensis]|uniref:aldo/keto reductase n=1 Tax=Catelliglobosispora koreensis TaxID=129052 RepID=UPI000476F690|nr:aldo/keto reductase [Catelliglobosispora koreensis]
MRSWMLGDRVVNRMGFGSMRLTVNPDHSVALAVLRRARELGVNHVDTAAFYRTPGGVLEVGSGEVRFATELIRQALAPYPDDLVIATKVIPGHEPLRAQVEENLRRLGTDCLGIVNLRIIKRPGQDSIAESFGELARMRDEGLIKHLGLSNIRIDHLDEAKAIAPVVCVQNSYALDIRRDDDLLKDCGDRGIAFVPFFALAGNQREAGSLNDHSETVRQIAAAHEVTPHQIRLAWTLHQGEHVLAIPGTGDLRHLEQNIAAGSIRLSPEELTLLSVPPGQEQAPAH